MAIEVDKLEPDPKKLAVDGILLTAAVLQGLLSGATFLMAFCGCCTAKGRKRRHRPAVGVLTVGYPQQQLAIVPSPHPTPAHNDLPPSYDEVIRSIRGERRWSFIGAAARIAS
ncbi:uncharacterized protein [Branchiostoma lanceolatum]|uniref:uncharacterized protein isoform X1 n=1 Tax=Branchiostoma lanceolatum TaxID=7740 RepID=UPI003456A8E7